MPVRQKDISLMNQSDWLAPERIMKTLYNNLNLMENKIEVKVIASDSLLDNHYSSLSSTIERLEEVADRPTDFDLHLHKSEILNVVYIAATCENNQQTCDFLALLLSDLHFEQLKNCSRLIQERMKTHIQ